MDWFLYDNDLRHERVNIDLLACEVNIDIQPVFNYYKATTYICSYLYKQEDEYSQAMKQAL